MGVLPLEDARIMAIQYCDKIQELKNNYIGERNDVVVKEAVEYLNQIQTEVLRKKIKIEIKEELKNE